MRFEFLHPADQIIMMMERIYGYGMTTTSGGNLSILDDNGDIWITPAGVDKGSLDRGDIVCVKPNGTVVGKHRPSSEFPFHQMVFRSRPDLKAVVHAHPPALVAFSIVRKVPDLHLLPFDLQVCGEVRMAEYGLPGSMELAEKVAAVFAQGVNSVMLENHGVVVGGANLFDAFKAFETLEFIARIEINAKRAGKAVTLTPDQLEKAKSRKAPVMDEFIPCGYSSSELEARREMCKLIHRSYDQRLFTSTQGSFSQRLEDGSFVITPFGMDRKYLEPGDLVRIKNGMREAGKIPSRAVTLHQSIYDKHPHINSVIIAHPPNSMAFAVTDTVFDSRTIPESYILLRRTPKLPFGAAFMEPQETAKIFTKDKPIVICENDCIIATGNSLLNAFDRLEVCEYSAQAIISAGVLGEIVHIDDQKIDELEVAFNLKDTSEENASMLATRRIYWPSINLIGPGSVKEIGEEIIKLGKTKALLVTDKVLNQVGVVKQVTDVLDESGISYAIFDDVKPNPTTQNVNEGLDLFRREGCDFIISLGGGSPQDAAKAVGILSANGGSIVQYEGIGKSKHKSPPIIAINTTAGTASEVTINYVITDEARKIKMVMVDPNSLATIAVNDPELMVKKPASLTAATGLDALTHAIEAYVTKGAFPLSDALALQAIRFISGSLAAAVKDGTDLAARSEMAWGSYVAGLSFSNCGLGIVHSMAHQLGSEYDLPHGVANAILLPYVMEFNLDSNPKKFAEIAEAMGADTTAAANDLEAAKLALDAVRKMSAELGIPPLKNTSFNPDDVEKLAEQAMRDVCTGGNPKDVTRNDMIAIYLKAYNG